jgi:glycine betaine/proline transport system permease protein
MDYLLNPFDYVTIPFGEWMEDLLAWLVGQLRETLLAAKAPVQTLLIAFQTVLIAIPPIVGLAAVGVVGWLAGGMRLAAIGVGCLATIGLIGAWENAMITLSIVLTAVSLCLIVGLPVGVIASRSDRMAKILRPVLDFMQTIPSFVYLVPVVMLFGIGNAPGVIVTCFFAIPPLIRLTNLGIRGVRADMVEASYAFGGSNLQTLLKIELPLARPTILAGVNQTVMLSLSMVVIASMISVAGLGRQVLEGIGRLDLGSAVVGGVGIVMTAIFIDRFTQALGLGRRARASRKG